MIGLNDKPSYMGKGWKGFRGARPLLDYKTVSFLSPGSTNRYQSYDSASYKSLIKRPSGYLTALGLLIVVVLSTAVLARMNWNGNSASEPKPIGLPARKSRAVIIDETDGLTREQYETCIREIEAIQAGQRTGDWFALYVIRKDENDRKGKVALLFAKERPRDGSNASFFNQNPPMLKKSFQKEYEEPLRQVLEALNPSRKAISSPILEAIRRVARLNDGGKDRLNELTLFSNMLEKGPQISFYGNKLPSFSSMLQAPLLLLDVKDILAGAKVTVYRLADDNYGPKHDKWWRQYFEYAGASYRSYLM